MAAAGAESIPEPESSQDQLPSTEVASGPPAQVNESQSPAGLRLMQEKFQQLSRGKQIQLIVAIAAALALVISIIFWSAGSPYKLLYGNLSERASAEIIEVLQQEGIDYQLDEISGEILVPPDQIHNIRIKLASQGLPKQEGEGFEILDRDQGFGTSQFMEKARYHRALEGELARSISGIDSVHSARVHLAIPKQSVFIRDRREPSASVLVNLKQGRDLSEAQIAAITHMVAASIPDLKAGNVTVIDQTGKLLSRRKLSGEMAMSTAQFDYKRKLEEYYIERIERILMPIVGFGGVRAQVDADIDFSVVESTQESFNPDLPAVRSEQIIEEESRGGGVTGVPGALTNQPPGAGEAPEQAKADQGEAASGPVRKSRRSTFNYELDKTISHVRKTPGTLRRLSVAVVVDDKVVVDEAGNVSRVPLTPEELNRMTELLKEAVGFNVQRGDSLHLMNESFMALKDLPEPPPPPLWEQGWFLTLAKQVIGVLLALLLIWILLRPVLRELRKKEDPELASEEDAQVSADAEEDELQAIIMEPIPTDTKEALASISTGMTEKEWRALGISQEEYEAMLDVLRKTVTEDPRVVAQVIKTWVASDEGEGEGLPASA